MVSPVAKGIIITVSLVVAAGIAAYENPHVREWVERSREKIAIALHSLGDDINPQTRREKKDDVSMREEQSEKAEEKRRQIRQEILEKGRLMEERMKRKRSSGSDGAEHDEKRSPSFDTLVDEDGKLRPQTDSPIPTAETSAVEVQDMTGSLRSRRVEQPMGNLHEPNIESMHESVDAPMLLRQLSGSQGRASEPWESQYEREMRNTWNIPLPERSAVPSSHASESLIDLTPTTEDFPDPEMSIPSISDREHPLSRSEYFSMPHSSTSQTVSDAGESDFYYAHPNHPMTPLEPRPMQENDTNLVPGSSAASVAGSTSHIHHSDLESEDDFSDFGDGIRTPASVWTDVGSTVSGDE